MHNDMHNDTPLAKANIFVTRCSRIVNIILHKLHNLQSILLRVLTYTVAYTSK